MQYGATLMNGEIFLKSRYIRMFERCECKEEVDGDLDFHHPRISRKNEACIDIQKRYDSIRHLWMLIIT